MKRPLSWLPWYIDSWLFGSSRHELTRAQRSDFLDLALLAGKDEGFIRANETTPYPLTQLAGLLVVKPADLEETIERCIQVGKITRFESGILFVTNYDRFKLTPQYRRRLEAGDLPQTPSSKIKKKREEESKGKGNTVSKKGNCVSEKGNSATPSPDNQEELDEKKIVLNREAGRFEGITEEKLQQWAEAFPAVHVQRAVKQCAAYFVANPEKRKSNWERTIVNWLKRDQEKGGDIGPGRRPDVDPYVGAHPKRKKTDEEIASWRKSAEREIRSSAISRGLKGDDLESAVQDALKDWDRDQRK